MKLRTTNKKTQENDQTNEDIYPDDKKEVGPKPHSLDSDLNIPFFSWLVNIDQTPQFWVWCLIRVFMALTITRNMLQADQWWQSTEIAYTLVYGT